MTDFTTITACGEYCVGCSKNKDGSCPGCIVADGRVPEGAGSGMCKVHACCKEHNARSCGLCSDFPCDKLPQMISWNPEIIKHLSAFRDEYICRSLSDKYAVRRLSEADISKILSLCEKNTLYYQFFPPFVSEQSIRDDMNALPPGKTMTDKYYVGYYDEDRLIAVMDLIMAFPNKTTAFIGFFMTEADAQRKGLGSALITELCNAMSGIGIKEVRLGWVKGNPQAEHFWKKNGFAETGATNETDKYTVVVARRGL
ncbi:MAG: GNAT family N-acetyltransferase [Lachnospiraceae bacterium]|nr:GNAT family N-acetyltransferase [Lachnospiraceae bacterium]MBR4608682.1 GNAT family N-acetyltransferase [Lachnospiraceae bacterium]